MNKAEMADRLAARTGLNKVGARDADEYPSGQDRGEFTFGP